MRPKKVYFFEKKGKIKKKCSLGFDPDRVAVTRKSGSPHHNLQGKFLKTQ